MDRISKRMKKVLSEAHRPTFSPVSMETHKDPRDLYSRAANVLALGLHNDLPDEVERAVDYLVDILNQLIRTKRPLLTQAVRNMGYPTKAMMLMKKIQREY